MNTSENMTMTNILGEAAVSLAAENIEISVDALLTELNSMLCREESHTSSRVTFIQQALDWLSDFLQPGTRNSLDATWLLQDDTDRQGRTGTAGTVRLPLDSHE